MSYTYPIYDEKYIKSKKFETIDLYFNNWRRNLSTLLKEFEINDFQLSKLLQLTKSVIAGGSLVCAFTEFCEPEKYDGDIDIFIHYNRTEFIKTDMLYDLFLTNSGYTVFDNWSKYSKPNECPVCYQSKEDINMQLLQPCEHWICEECLYKISNFSSFNQKRCPFCRNELWSEFSLFHSKIELEEMKENRKNENKRKQNIIKSNYDDILYIRHFKVYKKGNKVIQLIYNENPTKNISKFDLSICQLYYDGLKLYCKYPDLLLTNEGFVVHSIPLTEKQKNRIQKYSKRGFKITSAYSIHHSLLIDELPLEEDIKKYILNLYI